MAEEAIPQSVNSDDNLRITLTDVAASPLSVAALAAGTDLTYSLKTWDLQETQETVEDKRLSLSQNLKRPGRKNIALTVQYVFGDDGDVAAATLTEGSEHNATLRYSIANDTAWTAAQVADTLKFTCGAQRKDPPVENGVQTITQELFVTDRVQKDQAIVA